MARIDLARRGNAGKAYNKLQKNRQIHDNWSADVYFMLIISLDPERFELNFT